MHVFLSLTQLRRRHVGDHLNCAESVKGGLQVIRGTIVSRLLSSGGGMGIRLQSRIQHVEFIFGKLSRVSEQFIQNVRLAIWRLVARHKVPLPLPSSAGDPSAWIPDGVSCPKFLLAPD